MNEKTYVKGFHIDESVKKMPYTELGRTGMRVSQMSLGGGTFASFYDKINENECSDLVVEAVKNGINLIDTSPWYGQGTSERIIGKALKKIPREAYYIGTKVGRYEWDDSKMFDFSELKTRQSIETSMNLLGVDYLDIVQVHDVEFCADFSQIIEETLPTLLKLKNEGKLRFIGITGYPLSVLKEIILKSSVKIDVVLSYARNTLIDDSLEDYIMFFQSHNIGIMNACATSMGMFTTKCDPPSWHPASKEMLSATRESIRYIEKSYPHLEVSRLSIVHSLKMKGIDTHVFGSATMEILRKNLENIFVKITKEEEKAIDEIRQRFFIPLSKKHWEGNQGIEKYHQIEREKKQPTNS